LISTNFDLSKSCFKSINLGSNLKVVVLLTRFGASVVVHFEINGDGEHRLNKLSAATDKHLRAAVYTCDDFKK
jgi:hypothetical protein